MEGGDEDDEKSHEGTRNDSNQQRVNQKPAPLVSASGLCAGDEIAD
jgi:hypothetical protein